MLNLLEELNEEVLMEMVVVPWRLSERRNEVVFWKEFTSPTSLLKQTNIKLQDFRL